MDERVFFTSTDRSWRNRPTAVAVAAAAAGYAVLTVWFAWVPIRAAGSHYFSDTSDGPSFLWNYWELPHRLLSGQDPFATRDMFWPVGVHTAFATNTPLESFVAGPLSRVIGLHATSFVLGLVPIWLSGIAAYLLVVHVCGRPWPAFAAGVAFVCSPFRTWRLLGHLNLDHIELLAFGLLALLLLFERPTGKRAFLLGVVLALTVWTDLTYPVFLFLAALVLAVSRRRTTDWRAVAPRLAQAAAVTFVVSLPLIAFLVRDYAQHEVQPLRGLGGADGFSADLLSWITPPAAHPWWGEHFIRVGSGERTVYPGFAILAMAIVGAIGARTRRRIWIAIAAVFAVLALGPFLQVNGHAGRLFTYAQSHFSVPLPYLLFNKIPILNGARNPGRFGVMTALSLDVLAALGIVHLARGRLRVEVALSLALIAITLVEFLPPNRRELMTTRVPAAYRVITADRTKRAVLEVPIQWRDGFRGAGDGLGPDVTGRPGAPGDDSAFIAYAAVHHHPIVNGMVARLPDHRWDALLAIPAYRKVLSLQHDIAAPETATFGADDLKRLGIGWVVYHRDRPFPDVLASIESLGLPVAADDGVTIVWAVE